MRLTMRKRRMLYTEGIKRNIKLKRYGKKDKGREINELMMLEKERK